MELIEGVNAKVCNKCGELKSFEEFNKRKDSKDGYRNDCKRCKKVREKKYYEKNHEQLLEYRRNYYEENKEQCLEYGRKHYEENKEYYFKQNKRYYKENKQQIYKKAKKHREKNKERYIEYQKSYYEENKERYIEYQKSYYEENKERYFKYNRKRRALQSNATGNFTEEEFRNISLEFFDWKCAYTGESIKEDLSNCHREHIVPLTKGGDNGIWNIVPSLDWVNLSKNKSNMEEWYRKQPYFSEERLNKIYEYMHTMEQKYLMKECV